MSCLDCKYVGSRGLLNSCNRKSSIPVPDFDGLNPSLYENLQENDVIHVCPQALKSFVNKVLPKLTKPFILLTNNSDWTIPDDVRLEFFEIMNNPYLTHWYSQNCIIEHPKITRIPIGLDYHTLTPSRKANVAWSQPEKHAWGLKHEPIHQELQLSELQKVSRPFSEREVKCYANFQFLMGTRYGKIDRIECFNTVPNQLVYYEPRKCERIVSWQNMIDYAFVLSPHGNGLDCHRTWEALCLGCIPIVKSSGLDPLFEDLPVWIVSSWTEVTEENMQNKINEFIRRIFRYDKLQLSYWQTLIRNTGENGRGENKTSI